VNALKYISLFESLTRAKVKDYIEGEKPLFIVDKGDMGLALGKNRMNLKRVENVLKKSIRVIEFDADVSKFIKNYAYPLYKMDITQEGNKVIIKGHDTKTKALLIGRDKSNLKRMISDVKRFFDIEDISVV
jgi:N utilization substance protein A